MPTETQYTKTISTDFPNGKVNTSLLSSEIGQSSIVTAILRIDIYGDECSVWFRDELSTADQTTLDSVTASHMGIATVQMTEVKIVEEKTPTGGNFATTNIVINAVGNITTSTSISWPFPITALSMEFVTQVENTDDVVNVIVGENTIVGALGANTGTTSAWTAQNYTVGNIVTFTHPVFGSRTYTCIRNTVASEPPLYASYWKHGYPLVVSGTVLTYMLLGYHLILADGTNTENLGRVVGKDVANSKIYTERAPTTQYLATSPTYVKMSVYPVENLTLGVPASHSIGSSAIGGSYLPADIVITIKYTNNTGTTKKFMGRLEFLY